MPTFWPALRAARVVHDPNMKTESCTLGGVRACRNRRGGPLEPGSAASNGNLNNYPNNGMCHEEQICPCFTRFFFQITVHACWTACPERSGRCRQGARERPDLPARVRANPARFSDMTGRGPRAAWAPSRTVLRGASPASGVTHPAGAPSGAAGRGAPPSSRRCRPSTPPSLCGPACPCRHTSC